ncbi:MAG: hypothetical protein AB8B77_03460 [Alphaproteobacteria bacterium]
MAESLNLRPPEMMMKLARLGAFHQCRLSFMRQLTRRMAAEQWQFTRPRFDINSKGEGVAVYTAKTPNGCYSLVAFAHDLPADQRSDRVIATAWDATFTLFDGVPDDADIARLFKNVPKQEAGRISHTELSLSRANRSVRLWDYVLNKLAAGQQPSQCEIDKVGYLMRTTAVYGSGKFGSADRQMIQDRRELRAPFQVEMLSVFLTRAFVKDLIEHLAVEKGGDQAVRLDDDLAKRISIGNSTGLGMAPFLVNHPALLHQWIQAREQAIAHVRAIKTLQETEKTYFLNIFKRAQLSALNWQTDHELQAGKIKILHEDIKKIEQKLNANCLDQQNAWDSLIAWSQDHLSLEGQEWLASLILEPYPEITDRLQHEMHSDHSDFAIDGSMTNQELMDIIQRRFGWALAEDWDNHAHISRIWYVSQEKLEPRLGERFEEKLDPYEQPLGIGFQAFNAHQALLQRRGDEIIADFIDEYPQFRRIIRRIQLYADMAYSEIQDNVLGADLMPIDMLRAKLSFFGATRFDPRSDRWVRIAMFNGAPYPDQLNLENADDWVYAAP